MGDVMVGTDEPVHDDADLEDFEDEEIPPGPGLPGWISRVGPVTAVCGFVAVAWFAWRMSGSVEAGAVPGSPDPVAFDLSPSGTLS